MWTTLVTALAFLIGMVAIVHWFAVAGGRGPPVWRLGVGQDEVAEEMVEAPRGPNPISPAPTSVRFPMVALEQAKAADLTRTGTKPLPFDSLALVSLRGAGRAVVCSTGPIPAYSDSSPNAALSRPRHLVASSHGLNGTWSEAKSLCAAPNELLGKLVWTPRRVEYYPGERSWNLKSHAVGLVSFGSPDYLRASQNLRFHACKLAWAEVWSRPVWIFISDLNATVHDAIQHGLIQAEDLGTWWTDQNSSALPMGMLQAWQKPLVLLETIVRGNFEFVLYLDADAYPLIWTEDMSVFLPSTTHNANISNRIASEEKDVHLVAPMRTGGGQTRWSNWFFVLRSSQWSINFTKIWIAHSSCDCWADQGAMWLELLKAVALARNAKNQAGLCDWVYSPKAKAYMTLMLTKSGCWPSSLQSDCYKTHGSRSSPMLCQCRGFNCFERAIYNIAESKFNFTAITQAKRKWSSEGLVLPPVWWWREPFAINSQGYLSIVGHRK